MLLILYSEDYSIKDSNCCSNSFTQLGYGLRTLNTLSQLTGYPIYRVSIYMSPDSHMKIAPNSTNKRTEKRMEKRIKKGKTVCQQKIFFRLFKTFLFFAKLQHFHAKFATSRKQRPQSFFAQKSVFKMSKS